jgi:hypothetical protein
MNGPGVQREVAVSKPTSPPSIVDIAESNVRRRASSSPTRKQRSRESRRFGISVALILGSSLICLWLLLA